MAPVKKERACSRHRISSKRILSEVQRHLDTSLSASGNSARLLVSGSNPADVFDWRDADRDLPFACDTSLSGQFAQRRKSRISPQEPAQREVANSELRCLLAYNTLSNCADAKLGSSAFFYKAS